MLLPNLGYRQSISYQSRSKSAKIIRLDEYSKPYRAISTVVARFLHTEDVTGSNPVSPIYLIIKHQKRKSQKCYVKWQGDLNFRFQLEREKSCLENLGFLQHNRGDRLNNQFNPHLANLTQSIKLDLIKSLLARSAFRVNAVMRVLDNTRT